VIPLGFIRVCRLKVAMGYRETLFHCIMDRPVFSCMQYYPKDKQ